MKKFFPTVKKYFILMFSNIIIAFAVGCFYIPNKIVSGGVSGISNILFHSFNIPISISMIAINLIFAVIAFKKLGLKFLIPSFLNSVIIGILADIFTLYCPPMTFTPLLAAIFGGVLYGFGIAFCLVQGVSTGGTDILCRFLQAIMPHLKIGMVIMGVDLVIILMALLSFGQVDLVLYGMIALFISSYSVDWMIAKLNVSKLAFIVSEKGAEISRLLTATSPRGVTIINATGGYTMKPKALLICALKSNEIIEFQRKILEIDKTAFIIFSESQQVVGNGFRVYH